MKKFMLSGAALGVAMAVGAAQAEPLTLSTDQMDQVTAGDFVYADVSFRKDVYVRDYQDVYKTVFGFVFLDGNQAEANAVGQAFGSDTLAQSLTITYTDPFSSQAASESVSATYDPPRHCCK